MPLRGEVHVVHTSFREGILETLLPRHLGNVNGDEVSEAPEWFSGQ